MKKEFVLSSLLCLLFGSGLFAQTFVHDFETSKQMAQEESKEILMIFSGSDWCKPCIQMKKNIISSEEFSNYAEKNLVLLEVDFPYRKKNRLSKEQQKHNDALAEQFNPKGTFPLIVHLDAEGNVIQSMSYNAQLDSQHYLTILQPSK